MAAITHASLEALRTGFDQTFSGSLERVEPQYEKVATVVPSSTKSNTYGWLGAMPSFREWIGDRAMNSIKEHGYTIANKTFESSVDVSRDDFEDDNLGVYKPLVEEMAREGGLFPDELVFGLLAVGFTSTCYDGQFFFDTDHPVNSKADGSGADESVANMFEDTNYQGEPWYLLDCSRAVKPLIWQNRRPLSLTPQFSLTDESVFRRNTFEFGADLRGNAGFSFWQFAYAMKADLNVDNFWKAWEAMRGFKRDGGGKLKIKPTTLVVPASLERKANQLIERQLREENGAAVDNELLKKVEVVVADAL